MSARAQNTVSTSPCGLGSVSSRPGRGRAGTGHRGTWGSRALPSLLTAPQEHSDPSLPTSRSSTRQRKRRLFPATSSTCSHSRHRPTPTEEQGAYLHADSWPRVHHFQCRGGPLLPDTGLHELEGRRRTTQATVWGRRTRPGPSGPPLVLSVPNPPTLPRPRPGTHTSFQGHVGFWVCCVVRNQTSLRCKARRHSENASNMQRQKTDTRVLKVSVRCTDSGQGRHVSHASQIRTHSAHGKPGYLRRGRGGGGPRHEAPAQVPEPAHQLRPEAWRLSPPSPRTRPGQILGPLQFRPRAPLHRPCIGNSA